MGSRGSYTYQPVPSYQAAPIQRSITPQPQPMAPTMTPSYAPGYSYQTGSPFWSSMAGGFLGTGLAGMLFGHGWYGGYGGYGYGPGPVIYSPMGSLIGLLLQIILFVGLGWLIIRWWRSRVAISSEFMGINAPDAAFQPISAMPWGTPAGAPLESPLAIAPSDYQEFQQLLEKIQMAWGTADLNHLRQYLTPEMLQYFSEQLSGNTSRGEVNRISDVTFIEGNLAQSWSEAGLDYATVHMRWKAVDFMARLDREPGSADYVVSGDPIRAVEAQEIWTFCRARQGGHWLLSAIQQTT